MLRDKGTERPFTGRYTHPEFDGTFRCAACGAVLFSSVDQFDSGSGWPSFTQPVDAAAVVLTPDDSFGMRRVEVTCKACGGHLGHLFNDGPNPTGERWCINSVSLQLDDCPSLRSRVTDRHETARKLLPCHCRAVADRP